MRADCLGRLSRTGQQSMRDYGVRTIIDIRSPQEVAAEPYDLADAGGLLRLHLPIEKYYPHVGALIRNATSRFEVYCIVADHYPDAIVAILQAVSSAQPGGVVIHCHSGKDRTGMIAALLLAIACVPAGAIAADYAESQARLWPEYEQRLRQGNIASGEGLWQKPLAEPETMLGFLDHLNTRYGGIRTYLAQAGMPAFAIDQIQDRLGWR
ncbi:MAG: tyrosine-protein phosphatase [Anaerolineales bacterium]|nr:tyrosine-protein phosphatase [Anaerolineales bacterium]